MAYTTRPLSPEYRAEVLRLWKDNMSDSHIGSVLDERYRWLYERNPEGMATTVVAMNGDGAAIGCGSVYPRRLLVGGLELQGAVPADFAVDRQHRLGGAALAIQRALIEGRSGPLLFFGFPNKSSFPILRRVGYRTVSSAQGWVKPLRVAYKIRRFLPVEAVVRIAAVPLDGYLAIADLVRAPLNGSAKAEVLDRADARFDRLWERARSSYELTGERTSAYLNWRYAEFTTQRHQFLCLLDGGGSELLGYVVYAVKNNKVSIADLFAVDMAATAERLLLAFSRHMRRAGCQSVFLCFAGHPEFSERLSRLGFFPSGKDDRKLVALPKGLSAEQEALLFEPRNWHIFDGEMDI